MNVAERGPLKIEARFVMNPTASNLGQFQLHVQTEPNWHIDAMTVPEGLPYTATQLDLKLPKGAEALGDWLAPEAVASHDDEDLLCFEGKLVFRRQVRLAPENKAPLQCKISYMACDPDMCRPPEELTVKVLPR